MDTQTKPLTAVITGAAGGIGQAIAENFAAQGMRLALVDMLDTSELAARLGPDHRHFALDLQDPSAIETVIAKIGAEMGIDIVVNNAGAGILFPADETSLAGWDTTMSVNLRAPWLLSAAALPYLKASKSGRIVNIASQAGIVAIEDHIAYGASKAGLIMVTKVLALEWAKFGITVNCIAPTVVETPMALVGWSGEKGVKARQDIPLGRFAKPEEIAAAVAYLSSASASIITGETLVVDGGYTIK